MTDQQTEWVFDPSRYPDNLPLDKDWRGPKPMSLHLDATDCFKEFNLAADAPKILAECVRLREENERLRNTKGNDDD